LVQKVTLRGGEMASWEINRELVRTTEENFLQAMRRDYGRLAAWVERSNRLYGGV
jgi:hypothetical protein